MCIASNSYCLKLYWKNTFFFDNVELCTLDHWNFFQRFGSHVVMGWTPHWKVVLWSKLVSPIVSCPWARHCITQCLSPLRSSTGCWLTVKETLPNAWGGITLSWTRNYLGWWGAGVGTFLVIYCSYENQEELEGFDVCCSSCWAAYIDFNKR